MVCEQRVARAWDAERPRQLLKAIRDGGCSALLAGGPSECVSCRICPSNAAWEYLAGYYRGAKQKLYVCAEKEPSQQQVEDVLTHELTHAYDHCRFGVKFPPVVGWRTQAPWRSPMAAAVLADSMFLAVFLEDTLSFADSIRSHFRQLLKTTVSFKK